MFIAIFTSQSVSRVHHVQVTWSNTHAWALLSRAASIIFQRYHWLPAFSQSQGLSFGCAWQSSPSFSGTTRFMGPRQNRGGSGSRILTITTFITRSTFWCTRNRFVQVCTGLCWSSCACFVLLRKLQQFWAAWRHVENHGWIVSNLLLVVGLILRHFPCHIFGFILPNVCCISLP